MNSWFSTLPERETLAHVLNAHLTLQNPNKSKILILFLCSAS